MADLVPDTSVSGRSLALDFPSLAIGVAQYAEGPTGVTVFRFAERAMGCVDVRGGAPGTYNADWLKLGYGFPNLDAVAISGGSWYGLAAAAGVARELMDSGVRSGEKTNLASVAGAIIYDLGERRPNAIHPDERLGAAATRAARPGRFPQGAQGAGRMAMQGSYFGLALHSGQGGAFREVEGVKIACFAVVNATGVVADRAGRLRYGNQACSIKARRVEDLIARVPAEIRTPLGSALGRGVPDRQNTTISLVVTNQRLAYSDLSRLAVQVHTSMARAIQPFATLNDGDVLFAASTGEVTEAGLHPTDLGVIASETMWDAILASTPDIAKDAGASYLDSLASADIAGTYRFGEGLCLEAILEGRRVTLRNTGERSIFGLAPGKGCEAAGHGRVFETKEKYLVSFGFAMRGSAPVLVLNPGPWRHVSAPRR